MAHDLEFAVVEERIHVRARAGEEIIDAKHLATLIEQDSAEMRAQEPGAAGNQYALAHFHDSRLIGSRKAFPRIGVSPWHCGTNHGAGGRSPGRTHRW